MTSTSHEPFTVSKTFHPILPPAYNLHGTKTSKEKRRLVGYIIHGQELLEMEHGVLQTHMKQNKGSNGKENRRVWRDHEEYLSVYPVHLLPRGAQKGKKWPTQ